MSAQKIIQGLDFVTNVQEYKEGMPIMIECFATWCPPCRGAIPHLAEMHAKFQNVYLVSISREDKAKVEALKKNMPLMGKYNLAVDLRKDGLEKYMEEQNVEGIPHCFIFDKTGNMVWQGHPMDGECKQHLEKLNK
uniref:Redoxin domain protein n=1 Tax=Trepomonas sp. PC1 TaxID=1076344 RepID=A0A146KIY9_9EUKA|eukprot:JAP95361.1 Redoxin domain protein [Trepomonas sp. PC1]